MRAGEVEVIPLGSGWNLRELGDRARGIVGATQR
jgi:hypothetical protein